MLIKLHKKHLIKSSVNLISITASKKTKLKCSHLLNKKPRLLHKNPSLSKQKEAMKKFAKWCNDLFAKRMETMRTQLARTQSEFQHKLYPLSAIISIMRLQSTTLTKLYQCKRLKYPLISNRWASQSCQSRQFPPRQIKAVTLDPVLSLASETSMSK